MSGSHRFAVRTLTLAIATTSIGFGSVASASMGNIGTTYGVMPVDVATAQSLSMFNDQVSATYYNPSYLTTDERGELTSGILHAEQELRAAREGVDSDILANPPSQHVLVGMKTNLGSLTRFNHPLYLGFIAGVEKYGKEMLAFSSQTSETGQYLQYGQEPLFLNIGGATPLWRGISVGASVRITLEANAELNATSDLAGNTENEQLAVNAQPTVKTIYGTTVKWGQTLCPSGCFLDGLETAFTYRSESSAETSVDANVTVNGVIQDPGLALAVATFDSFQPETLGFGIQYKGNGWRIGASAEQQKWSSLGERFSSDTIRDQASVTNPENRILFEDIIVPRLGMEIDIGQHFAIRGGVAYEESPLVSTRNPELNYLDTNKLIAGLGLSVTYDRTRLFAYPIRFDIGYQYQQLEEREFTIVDSNNDPANDVSVLADGDVHVVSGSVTFKF